jgi:hypothetical protein
MAFAWAGHGSPSSTLSKDVGSIRYSIASPDLATRPPHCPFHDTTWPWPFPCFLSLISHVILSNFSPYISFCPAHHIPLMPSDPLARPRGALKRAVSSNHSLAFLFPLGQAVVHPPFPIGSQASPDPDPVPHWSSQGFCLGWLVPISQTDSKRAAYSSPWWWRQQGPLKRW